MAKKTTISREVPHLSIICPMYNESEVVTAFFRHIYEVLEKINLSFEVICINDGSTDTTLSKLIALKSIYPNTRVINFSRNFGKEAALTAGLVLAKGRSVVPIDADLQDPPELITKMLAKMEEGYDVVLAQRVDRGEDSFIKRNSASLFYKMHNHIANINIPENVGDYRLMTRKVVDVVNQMPENQRFMKGVFAWVGFKTTIIEYSRPSRRAGKTSFNLWGLWNFALDGITSFSTAPLRIWLYVGTVLSFASFAYGFFIFFRTLILGVDLPGYASILTVMLFIGGVQLISLGILGEYIGRTYLEAKRRPSYVIDREY